MLGILSRSSSVASAASSTATRSVVASATRSSSIRFAAATTTAAWKQQRNPSVRSLSTSSASNPLPRALSVATPKETIVKLLYHIGNREELEQYLSLFADNTSKKYAVVKVGGAILEDELENLAQSLAFLSKVGLNPIVVHGAGPQLNKVLEAAGIEPQYENGIRVTTPETLAIARKVFSQANLNLVAALEGCGMSARPIINGLFNADYLDQKKYQLVGKITSLNKEVLDSCLRTGSIPVVTSLAETPHGQILNVNADIAAAELARAVQPMKVIYLNTTAGLVNGDTKKVIPTINMDEEYEELLKQPWVKYGTRLKIIEIRELLLTLPRTASVSITSTEHLPRELFTHKGAGTLIRLGQKIHKYDTLTPADKERFEKVLSSDVIEQLKPGEFTIYVDETNEGGAVILHPPGQDPYLLQMSVKKSYFSVNVRQSLWSRIRKDFPTLYWNNVKSQDGGWSFQECDGSITSNERTLFWYGDAPMTRAEQQSSRLLAFPPSIRRFFSTSSRSTASPKKVGLIGARGYVGKEFMQLLEKHDELELGYVSSRELEGKPVDFSKKSLKYVSFSPKDCADHDDVGCWVMALPNDACKPFVDEIRKKHDSNPATAPVILDLSADYRFDKEWQYGLTERFRKDIRGAKRISNPGCYATGMQMSMFPAVQHLGAKQPTAFGVSGYSGAGTKPSKNNDPEYLRDNLVPYTMINHMHEREVSYQVGTPIRFMPHVAPFFRGISLTVSMSLNRYVKETEIVDLYKEYFKNEPLVKVLGTEVPVVKDIMGKHHVEIGGIRSIDGSDGPRMVVIATIDNLLKGAATQALQNINVACGIEELKGIL